MLNIVLYQPEIPPNTGNVMRLCANAGARLHLVGPLGFTLDDKQLRRAGLDYRDRAAVTTYADWDDWLERVGWQTVWAFSTRGQTAHSAARFHTGDTLLFGPESRGLPRALLDRAGAEHTLRVPMRADSRSLNLSNCVAIALYEALRQLAFPDLN
ncbi:MAG: tRNA (cytidine(34)-2'-O)-methyltransferase [Xanthomonadales bacterium]